ncbi:hypothetical protein GCM10027280_14680 [Micromonospora polyrhachis]
MGRTFPDMADALVRKALRLAVPAVSFDDSSMSAQPIMSLRSTRIAMSSRGDSAEKPIAVERSRAAITSAE